MNLGKKQNFLVNFAFYATVLLIVFFSFKFVIFYMSPFLIGAVIACLMQKPAKALSARTNIKKESCAAVLSIFTYVAVLAATVLFVWLALANSSNLTDYLTALGNTLKNTAKSFNLYISSFKSDNDWSFDVNNVINDTVGKFMGMAVSAVSNTAASIIKNIPIIFITSLVTVVATCYIAKDYDKLKRFLKGIANEKICENAIVIKGIFTESVLKFVCGYLKIAAITFAELCIGFFILGIKNFLVVAFFVSLIDLLPVFGVGTVMLPWSVILLLQNNIKLAVGITVLYAIVSVIRNFIEPKIIGKQIGINPLFTLVSMFVGLKIAGVAGMLFFPIALIVLFSFYSNKIHGR